MNYTVNIQDNATPVIQELLERMRDRTNLHKAMGYSAKSHIVEYVRAYKDSRHKSADRLGAPHTNFVGQAVENLETSESPADGDKVTIRLDHPWWARAFGDVTINPSKTYLTIPLVMEAYGHRAPTIQGLFFWTNQKTGKSFLAEAISSPGTKGTLVLWYLLLKVVHQAQERERLPSDEEIEKSAREGATAYFENFILRTLEKRGASQQTTTE